MYFYSDGIYEALNSKTGLFGTRRLLSVLHQGRTLPLGESLAMLMKTVQLWSGTTRLHDDVSILALEIAFPDTKPIP